MMTKQYLPVNSRPGQDSLRAAIRLRIAFLPSSKSIKVLSAAKSGLGMPANPGLKLRLISIDLKLILVAV